jgi:hypothetical protein
MMTLSTYKINKIMEKWVNGKEVKAIAREEKVCPETVRRYLEQNGDKTGYKRGFSEKIVSSKITFGAPPHQNNHAKLGGMKTIKKSEDEGQNRNASPEIDSVCTRLELMMQQEESLRTTLLDTDSIKIQNPNQSVIMQQLMEEIKNIHGQLAEFRKEIGSLQSSVKKNQIID